MPEQKVGVALLAGGVAAVVGGIAWGLVVKWTDYEVGILALGIGLLTAFAVDRSTGGRRGRDLQIVGVGTALVGILIGKYLSFAFVAQDIFPGVGVLSGEMFRLFRDALHEIFGLFDLIWIALAVGRRGWRSRTTDAEPATPCRRSRRLSRARRAAAPLAQPGRPADAGPARTVCESRSTGS